MTTRPGNAHFPTQGLIVAVTFVMILGGIGVAGLSPQLGKGRPAAVGGTEAFGSSAIGPNGTINSSITAGFNADSVPGGNVIWLSAVLQLTGPTPNATDLDWAGLHIHFVHQTLTFTETGGVTFVKYLPDGIVAFSKTANGATTRWDSQNNAWYTTVPLSYRGDAFLGGYAYYTNSSGIPGSTHVTWSGQFLSSECAFQFNWKFAAAVYTQFSGFQTAPNYPGIGVKPVDDTKLSAYKNSDHAGTPENFTAYLAQGAMGGGGSNYTGSYSGTAGVSKPYVGGCVST